MSKTLPILAGFALLAAPLMAQARGFDSTITTKLDSAVKIEVILSDDLAYRADNLPKKASDRRGGITGSAFSNNGEFGQRALEELIEEVYEELNEDFAKAGVSVSEDAPVLLRVTLVDAKPNRPTFNQLSAEPSLSFDSFGIGGAEIEAELIGAGGENLGKMEYENYPPLDNYGFFRGAVWQDANRAISRFSKKATKTLAAKKTS